ncbi:hypothetical protein GCM10010211_30860 [Streptomyces albospinus]|uniref:Uncharacterized protein n=1 Tax=Streptomyces albospinus TaxID=285515 RepID=A0ABQ2V324_9ACTN|nr:hypothetical protein [Streptomyces albospinus]GGU63648.1 hypothetical protein GCM10010211_30860 [Streptomyces albospinus]
MGKTLHVVAGALGAGALLLSVAGTASAGGRGGEIFDQDIHCAPSFSLSLIPPLTPGDGCRTNIFIDNQKRIASITQNAGGSISSTVVADTFGRGGRGGLGRGTLGFFNGR